MQSVDREEAKNAFLRQGPSPLVSSRYGFINSGEVVAMLEAKGFKCLTKSNTGRTGKNGLNYGPHSATFELPGDLSKQVGDVMPRLYFINSHDGTTTAKIVLGFYRLVCSNGLVISSGFNVESTVKHLGSNASNRFTDIAAQTIELVPEIIAERQRMIDKILQHGHIDQIITEVSDLVRDYRGLIASDFDLAKTRRSEDSGHTLWQWFNKLQENATGALKGFKEVIDLDTGVVTRVPSRVNKLRHPTKSLELSAKIFEICRKVV